MLVFNQGASQAAQCLWAFCRKQPRLRPIRPDQQLPARQKPWSEIRPRHGQQAGRAFHHYRPRCAVILTNKRDVTAGFLRIFRFHQTANPFSPGSRLTGSAPAQHHPACPRAVGRQLVGARPKRPVPVKRLNLLFAQCCQKRFLPYWRERCEPADVQFR